MWGEGVRWICRGWGGRDREVGGVGRRAEGLGGIGFCLHHWVLLAIHSEECSRNASSTSHQ